MARKAIPTLKSEIATLLPDNATGAVSVADVRGTLVDIVDSVAGVAGTRGSRLWITTGLPTVAGLPGAASGDLALNGASREFYRFDGTLWSPTGVVIPAGVRGAIWHTGSTVPDPSPDPSLVNVDDWYLRSTTGDGDGDIYAWDGHLWTLEGNIKGTDGIDGTDGAVWHTINSAGPPTAQQIASPNVGDFALDDTAEIWEYQHSGVLNRDAWQSSGINIRGTRGATGRVGPAGGYAYYAEAELDFTAVTSPLAQAAMWEVELMDETFPGGLHAAVPFTSFYEGFVLLDLKDTANYNLILTFSHDIGGTVFSSSRTHVAHIRANELFTLPLAEFDSVSTVNLGSYLAPDGTTVEITEAMLAMETQFTMGLRVTRVTSGQMVGVQAASIMSGAAHFWQQALGTANLAKGEPGEPGAGVPVGGATGQVLAKASGTDRDTAWVDQTGGGGDATFAILSTLAPDNEDEGVPGQLWWRVSGSALVELWRFTATAWARIVDFTQITQAGLFAPVESILVPGDNVTIVPDGDAHTLTVNAEGRQIESTNTVYVNTVGPNNDPARPQLYAPPQIGAVWANDGSEEHTGARPIAKSLRINEISSDDTRALTHRYAYSFTESAGTQRVSESSQRVQSFGSVTRGQGVDNMTRPEWIWDDSAKNFNQRNTAATVANWGSTTLTNHITVTVPLEGPGWVEGIELECRLLRDSVAAVNIPANGLVQTHQFPDSSHPRPRSVQFQFNVTNNQLAGDHAQKMWCDLAVDGAHASLERGPVTIEFASPFLGTVPVIAGNFSGRQQGILVGYADNVSDPSLSYMRQLNYFEDINGVPTDRGVAYYVATEDLAKLVLNCYSKPPSDEVAQHNEGTLSLWTELDGVISRHVVASRVCPEGSRYNLYATIRGVLSGQRFWWTYDSHEDAGAFSNNSAIGNPMADWDANRLDTDTLTTVIVPGLKRKTSVLSSPESAASSGSRVLITADNRPAPIADWDSLRFRVWGSNNVDTWSHVDLDFAEDMRAGAISATRIGNSTGQGADPCYLQVDASGDLILNGFSGRILDVQLVYWL